MDNTYEKLKVCKVFSIQGNHPQDCIGQEVFIQRYFQTRHVDVCQGDMGADLPLPFTCDNRQKFLPVGGYRKSQFLQCWAGEESPYSPEQVWIAAVERPSWYSQGNQQLSALNSLTLSADAITVFLWGHHRIQIYRHHSTIMLLCVWMCVCITWRLNGARIRLQPWNSAVLAHQSCYSNTGMQV